MDSQWSGFIAFFVRHRIAAILLMVLSFLCGGWALLNLNSQFLPNFGLKIITVTVAWPGASPAEVERSITTPLEEELSDVDLVKKLTSVSSQGLSFVVIEFKQSVRMSTALMDVQNRIARVRNLPQESRKPIAKLVPIYDMIARLVVTSDDDVQALQPWVRRFRRELLGRGIAKVNIQGLPKQELTIGLTPIELARLHASLSSLGHTIAKQSQDVPLGVVGQQQGGRQMRITQQKRSAQAMAQTPIVSGNVKVLFHLFDIGEVSLQNADHPRLLFYQGRPAVELDLFRAQSANAFHSARALHQWVKKVRPSLPKGMQLHVYGEFWHLIRDRLNLLLKNGASGLLMILALLFVFLNFRVAWWVALGIPISLSVALFVLQLTGGSINMISLFAMIMSLGIIVDDTIVVAEQGVSEYYAGKSATDAVITGARRMVVPIVASSLTTVAAFLPLLMLSGLFGSILIAIPRLIICVIIASLIESFFILPMHLKHSLAKIDLARPHPLRKKINDCFFHFRDIHFRRFVLLALEHYITTLVIAFGSLLLVVGVLVGDHIDFNFFPTPPGRIVHLDATFSAGTSTAKIQQFLSAAQVAIDRVKSELANRDKNLVTSVMAFTHKGTDPYETRSAKRLGSVVIELSPVDHRQVTNNEFIAKLKKQLVLPPGVDNLRIAGPRAGPPGADIDIGLYGKDAGQLKQAALALQKKISGFSGVSNVTDNLPFSQAEIVLKLRPEAYAAGLTVADIGQQLRAAYSGHLVQIYHHQGGEIEVRARLSRTARSQLASLEQVPIVTSKGKLLPLHSVVEFKTHQSFDSLQHLDRRLTVNVVAQVDAAGGNANRIVGSLQEHFLPSLQSRFGIHYTMKGRSRDQDQTLDEMLLALYLALGLIYIVLAWVSSSFIWPVFVMLAIPLGLEGAVLGHLLLGYDLTLLSLFGFFGLSGIVINDSIILLFRYKELVDQGMSSLEAIVEACCQRFRPVVLTSLTTIAGLAPILLERSMQAQFLVPMAISICFGLVVATCSVLIVIPACIRCKHGLLQWYATVRS